MASTDDAVLHITEMIVVIVTSTITIGLAIYHYIFRKGKKTALNENHNKLIDDRVLKVEQGLADLKKWAEEEHADMNGETRKSLDKMTEAITDLGREISTLSGYVKGKNEHS